MADGHNHDHDHTGHDHEGHDHDGTTTGSTDSSDTASWLFSFGASDVQAKATRKGFQLLPDYACTTHMVQGMTLLALIADCGDVVDAGGLT